MDTRTEQMGRTWRRCNPALARDLRFIAHTMSTAAARDRQAWAQVWGPFLVEMAAHAGAGRPLSARQGHAVTKALAEAWPRRWARFPDYPAHPDDREGVS